MVAKAESVAARTAVEDGINASDAVVFRGDGEPKTPEGLVARLSEIVSSRGIEADNYSNGGVVGELEERFAAILGKEAAVFMPSGTLANHLALRMLCGGKPRAIVQEQSHLYHDTGDCVQQLSGINMVPLAPGRPYFTLDEVRDAVEESVGGRVLTPVGALMIESPVRRQHGQIMPLDEMRKVAAFCSEQGIPTHLDGARLFMMSAATGVSSCRVLCYVRHGVRLTVQVLRRTIRRDTRWDVRLLPRPVPPSQDVRRRSIERSYARSLGAGRS